MVVARGAQLETMGIVAELPPDLSPFQRGTRGVWQGVAFELVGRVRVAWRDGSWNEWCAVFSDGRTGWLADAQGLLMISFAEQAPQNLPSMHECQVGEDLYLFGRRWSITDVKETTCLGSEGELPFAAVPKSTRRSVDLAGFAGMPWDFATIEYHAEGPQLFVGAYVKMGDLQLSQLRLVPGWDGEVTQEKNQTTALPCPNCGAPVHLRAAGLSMSAVCGSCNSLLDASKPELRLIEKAHATQSKLRTVIPIGQRGLLRGVEWEVIGFCQRKDTSAQWSEYLLFNPWHGFRWLVTYQGHWSFVERLCGQRGNITPTQDGLFADFQGHSFRLYARGATKVVAVLGEFYWRVRRGETAMLSDFVAPPYILSRESYEELNEFTWSQGVYVPPAEVEQAFKVRLQAPVGHYLNATNPFAERWQTARPIFVIALVAILVGQFLIASFRQESDVVRLDTVYKRPANVTPPATSSSILFPSAAPTPAPEAAPEPAPSPLPPGSDPPPAYVSEHFKLDGSTSRVEVEGYAGVSNSWLDADLDLVNVTTGEHYDSEFEISYYYGSDWTEGGTTASATFQAVPPGEYYLTADWDADPSVDNLGVGLKVKRGGLYWSNFYIVLGLISLYPGTLWYRRWRFEVDRWSESDFSPYASSDDSDD